MKTSDASSLNAYEELLREWAPKLDLVAPGDLERLRERHIDDSLRLLPLLEGLPKGRCVDVGSGAGLPGIPLAIASGRPWRLVEPRKRRTAFLEEVVRELGLDCEVVAARAEALASDPDFAEGHILATARAVAPPPEAFQLLTPLVAPGGAAAVFVGADSVIPASAELWQPGIAILRGDATSEGKLK